jgi:hypothetical protein
MGRTLLCSLAGAGVGCAVVRIVAGTQPVTDTGPAMLFVGVFLAIAGAIIGGVADLREFYTRKDQAPKDARDRDR